MSLFRDNKPSTDARRFLHYGEPRTIDQRIRRVLFGETQPDEIYHFGWQSHVGLKLSRFSRVDDVRFHPPWASSGCSKWSVISKSKPRLLHFSKQREFRSPRLRRSPTSPTPTSGDAYGVAKTFCDPKMVPGLSNDRSAVFACQRDFVYNPTTRVGGRVVRPTRKDHVPRRAANFTRHNSELRLRGTRLPARDWADAPHSVQSHVAMPAIWTRP